MYYCISLGKLTKMSIDYYTETLAVFRVKLCVLRSSKWVVFFNASYPYSR